MGRLMTTTGVEKRLAVRRAFDQEPSIDHATLRSRFNVPEAIVKSAITLTAKAWETLLAANGNAPVPRTVANLVTRSDDSIAHARGNVGKKEIDEVEALLTPEKGYVHFDRVPAKMGEDYIFWIPRVYIKNGIVDPTREYRVFLKKTGKNR